MRKGPVYLSVTSSADLKALDATNQKLRNLGKTAKSSSSGFKSFGKALGAIGGISAGIALGAKAVKEATEAFKVSAGTAQILKNTGLAASVSADQIGNLAMQISNLTGIDDEQVQAASNVLLGFQGLVPAGKNAQATLANLTQVATDLGSRLGKDPAAAAKVLGKALIDPAKGVQLLYRAGLPLDKQLGDRIKNMAKAGQVEQARALVLQQITQQTKGYASAVADPMMRLQTMFNNLLETLGTPILNALTPILASLTPLMKDLSPVFAQVGELLGIVVTALADGLRPVLPIIIGLIKTLTPSFAQLAAEVGALLPLVVALTPGLVALINLMGEGLPMALNWSATAIRGVVIALSQWFNLMAKLPAIGPLKHLKQGFIDAAAAAQATIDQLDVISKTDYSKLSAGLSTQTTDYASAAAALAAGAKSANAAANAVGSAAGRSKTKPKTATSPRVAAGNQSFTVAGSGGGLSLSVTVNGSVVQERDIARTIRDELIQFSRRQGVSPNFGV